MLVGVLRSGLFDSKVRVLAVSSGPFAGAELGELECELLVSRVGVRKPAVSMLGALQLREYAPMKPLPRLGRVGMLRLVERGVAPRLKYVGTCNRWLVLLEENAVRGRRGGVAPALASGSA